MFDAHRSLDLRAFCFPVARMCATAGALEDRGGGMQMNLVKTIRIEMSDWNSRQQFGDIAVVGDSGTRTLEFSLYEGGRE